MTTLEHLFVIGPTHHLIGHLPGNTPIGAFEFHPLPDERVQKAFALWSNSLLGMMTHWTRGQRTQKGRSTTQIGALKKIPCPNLARLPAGWLAVVLAFDELSKLPLQPACQAHGDENRKRIDEAVCEMLGLSGMRTTIKQLRYAWGREPGVHGENKTAKRLLNKPGNRSVKKRKRLHADEKWSRIKT